MRRIFTYVGRHHLGMLATFIALGGTAVAAGTSAESTIHACANIRTGALRLVHRARGCRRYERAVAWSKLGPAGPSAGYSSVAYGDLASVKVPPGDYIADGGCTAVQYRTASQSSTIPAFGEAQAFLTTGYDSPPGTVETDAAVPNMGAHDENGSEYGTADLSNSGGFRLPYGGTISETCRQYVLPTGSALSDQPVQIGSTYVTAIRVGSLQEKDDIPPGP